MNSNYFEFYGFELSFDVDVNDLRTAYFAKSKEFHPDYHCQSPTAEQEKAVELSIFNNAAYQTLKDDDKRMAYILQLKGIELNNHQTLPADFLMEMMDFNEDLDNLKAHFSEVNLEILKNDLQQIAKKLQAELKELVFSKEKPTSAIEILFRKSQFIQKLLRTAQQLANDNK